MSGAFKSYRTASGASIQATLAKFGEKAGAALGRQLYREGLGIMAASQPLVPVDTAALRSSGYVAEPTTGAADGVVEVLLGYGGPAAKINSKTGESTDAYALYVHEDLEAFHKVGTAKYLSLPFDQATRGMGRRLAENLKADLAGMSTPFGAESG